MTRPGGPDPIEGSGSFAARFGVSRETIGRLETYADLLKQWQKGVNLVAPSTLAVIWERHFADSAQLAALAPTGLRVWVDLGSGAGFPGLVVAIMLADPARAGNAVRMVLVESDSRKAAFLREVARRTALDPARVAVDILSARIENITTQGSLESVDVVSARALAPLDLLLALSAPLFGAQTMGVYLKGREAEREVEAARKRWNFSADLVPSLTDPDGRIVVVRALRARTED